MKILTIGSCRVKNPTRVYRRCKDTSMELYMILPHLHTLEQIIQAIEILKGIRPNHKDIINKRSGNLECIKTKKITIPINKIDKYIIEISGVTNYLCEHGYYLSPFPKFYKHTKYKKVYSDNYVAKLKKIHKLLDNKPILFVSNHNIYNKPSRTKMIQTLDEYCHNNLNTEFLNPTILMDKQNIKKYLLNMNHYSPYMILKLALEIFPKIKKL